MLQDIHEESVTKKYPIGMRYAIDDRVFRYCHAESNPGGVSPLILRSRAVVNKHKPVLATGVIAALAGATQITCTVAGVADGDYENGYIIQQPTVDWAGNMILAIRNNVGGVYTLKNPLIYPVAATDNLFFSKNIYAAVGKIPTNGEGKEYMSWVAVPLMDVTPEYYFWGQTWGPCCVQFGEGTPHRPGESPSERFFGFDYYGAAVYASDALGIHSCGFVLPNTWGTYSMLCMLQISP